MSGASNFSFIHPRSFKAGKLGDKANSLNSSDESIFTLNVDEDKHSSDLSSAEYHMEKKKKKRIKLEQCDEDGIQVRLYDSPEEPMKKKKKKNKCRIVEELSMEDSVDLNNICLNDMNNLECSSSGDSPKKKHKKKQCEGNAEEALVSDPHVTLENVMSKKKKKKKKKKEKVKESEVSEYSKDDKFCDSNIVLEEVVRKKKNKKKNHDGENSVSKIVHLEYSYGEQNQESLSSARKKKKKRPADDTELDDVGGESTKQHDVESENDNSKKKRKRSPESKKMKEQQNNSIEIFGQVSEEEVKIEIVEENLEANHGSLKKKKKKRNAMTKEEDAMEIEHQEDVCDGLEAQHFNSSNKRKKKKHKKKNDENAEVGFADVEEDCTIQDSLRFENDDTSKKRKSSTKPTKKEKRKNNSCDNYFEQVTEEEIADQEECDKQQTKHLDSPNKKQKKNQKNKCDGNIEDESFSENGEQISANIEADGADNDSTQEEDSKIEIVVENLDFSKNEKRKDDVEMEEVDGMKSEHQEDEEHDDPETQQSDSFGNKQTKKQHQKEGDGNSDDFFNVENVKPQEPPLMRPAKAAESMRKQKIESFDVDVDDLFDKSMEEQFLRKDQVAVLDNLCVRVPFEIPPLHLIETQIIKALTPSEKTMIANLDLTVKTGAYNKNEDEQIKNNWEQFCQHHHLNKDEPYLFTRFKHRNAKVLPASERFKFLRFLAHGMPDRLLSSVYRRFQRNFRTKTLTTGRYTEAEDKIILDYMKTHTGQVYLELGQILNRDRYSVESRYKKLTSEKATVTWSDDLSKKLVNTLQKCCGVSKSELEYWDISPEEWKQVEEEMEIPLRILKRTWLHGVYVKLFIDGEIDSKDIRQDMIETMYESGADDWKTVNWSQIAGRYKGFTPERICKIYKDIVAVHVPKKLHTDFRKSAVHLREQVLKDPDGYLRKRIYKKLPFK